MVMELLLSALGMCGVLGAELGKELGVELVSEFSTVTSPSSLL